MDKNIGKNINKNVSGKYIQKLPDHAKKICNRCTKIANKFTGVSKNSQQSISETFIND